MKSFSMNSILNFLEIQYVQNLIHNEQLCQEEADMNM